MFELIKAHQLNIMLALTAVCLLIAFLLVFTKALSAKRKKILIAVELIAACLLYFDRMAYIYAGDPSITGYFMVRFSNFIVFFMTSGVLLGFNLYLADLLKVEGKLEQIPRRLMVVQIGSLIGMMLIVITQFTGWIYYVDEANLYHRGPVFLLGYVLPVVCPLIQFSVIWQYRKCFSRLILTAMIVYIFVPVTCGIIQIYAYGISIVNMSMVLVSIFFYIFTYLDINDEMERMHRAEMEELEKEKRSMKMLFEQTVIAFVNGAEKKDGVHQGHSGHVAEMARRIAKASGKSEEECDEVYYTALLHNVGMVALPDNVLLRRDNPGSEEKKILRQLPEISSEILSGITAYPYLSEGARYCYEEYDGSGYPDGKKGDEIPVSSRIVAIAEAYEDLTTKKNNRDPLPMAFVREEFVKNAGSRFDPELTDVLVYLIDEDTNREAATENTNYEIEKEISCGRYRSTVSCGIPVERKITKIRFRCKPSKKKEDDFSAPSIILFDSFNRRVHKNEKEIEAFGYYEYAEIWFDGHGISTGVRNMEVTVSGAKEEPENSAEKDREEKDGRWYEITAARVEDHVKITMTGGNGTVTAILAMPDCTRSSYIGITGEHCQITELEAEQTETKIREEEIPRIAESVSFIDRMVSDLPNLQVDRWKSAFTEGIPVRDGLQISFHTRSLPTASLVWHCPYVILFRSEDQTVGGEGYREYAQVKLNGETDPEKEFAENHFTMKKREAFPGWRVWKEMNKDGVECKITFSRKGNRIVMTTENAGIYIENTTRLFDGAEEVFVSLTGDQVALTDIRIK